MIHLEPGNELTKTLTTADEVHTYYFPLEAHQSAQVSFTAPSLEYTVAYKLYKTLDEKGDTADSHEGGDIDFSMTTTFPITNPNDEQSVVELTVTASVLPSDGYTISMQLS